MSGSRKTARVVLRLDPFGTPPPALRAIAQLAQALNAELAARLIEDSRLLDALAFARASGASADTTPDSSVRRAERRLRRLIEEIAAPSAMVWSFDVVRCAGVFAAECALYETDLLAISLPEIERGMEILRAEISTGLARTNGVLLMPRAQPEQNRPIVGLVTDEAGLSQTVEAGTELAGSLRQPLSFVVAGDRSLFAGVRAAAASRWAGPGVIGLNAVPTLQLDFLAAHIRSLHPKLVIWAPPPSALLELLVHPRLLREMGAPLLLLRAHATRDLPA